MNFTIKIKRGRNFEVLHGGFILEVYSYLKGFCSTVEGCETEIMLVRSTVDLKGSESFSSEILKAFTAKNYLGYYIECLKNELSNFEID